MVVHVVESSSCDIYRLVWITIITPPLHTFFTKKYESKTKFRFFWWVCWGIRKRVCQSPWSIKYRDASKTGATTNIIIFPLFMFLQKNTHTHTHRPQIGKGEKHRTQATTHNSHWHNGEKHRRRAYLKANIRVSGLNFQVKEANLGYELIGP